MFSISRQRWKTFNIQTLRDITNKKKRLSELYMETLYLLRSVTSDFPGGPVGTRVWSLLWELRSCMPKRKNYNFSYRWGVKTHNLKSYFKKRKGAGNFPGGPVDKPPYFRCREPHVQSLVKKLDPYPTTNHAVHSNKQQQQKA